ncbi:ATP synthase F1 subunit delta [Liquorilactobacillus mali]|uniref:ATP synthase subunit delta n=1 Tax=Liquorilactobacillus mali TaxID=1618 RepID=A0A0R2G1G6_9LACO|nr:ATP synthase F1 subunit delta [Liquorilactobacillus mali]EJE98820.1 ATP synthase subunit delta [Liquorilactobacillus mali KCTC 3596 = DSM 20444]KRN34400.1 ATP synthase subunit delta [Liquorilactobacillus mali]MDN7144555.1 ATP synthase F1 subunit delta [Liquorilactobacillus mali]MDV7757035.1 F0F1 ATP synthase subunit delta [Liquorilactobacillus mali]QFQ74871.1 F0F1 ATP synthase subunit delta [Liquorilactobacillus mali]
MKLNKTIIAHRYGSALFELALEKDERQALKEELVELKQILVNEPKMMLLLTSKQISRVDKQKFIKTLGDSASETLKNLLDMLFDYDRIGDLDVIIDEYIRLNDEYEKTVKAVVTTAIPLESEQKAKLADSFARIVGANKVVLEEKVDSDIIGGVILRSNNYIYDGSLKLRFAQIKRMLLK